MRAPHNSKWGTNRTQAHPHHTKQCTFCTHFTFALTISTYTPIWAHFSTDFTKKCRTSKYARTPQFQMWYRSNPITSPQYKSVHFLHSFHIRTHHKHLYTEFGPISRPPSQKSAGRAYMHAPHNSKCGTNRTQAHPHQIKQCTF